MGRYSLQWYSERWLFQGLLRDSEGGQSEEPRHAEQAVGGLYDGACHRQDRKDLAPGQPLLSAPGMELRVLDTILAS